MEKKKSQHFVPRFYLRKFATDIDGRQIHIFNIPKQKFIRNGSLRDQAAKSYYYGKDLEIENGLAELEGMFAEAIGNIEKRQYPERGDQTLSAEFTNLMFFLVTMDFRNPARQEEVEAMDDFLYKQLLLADNKFRGLGKDFLKNYKITRTDSALKALTHSLHAANVIADLNIKVLINKTGIPFITSDYPTVRYNQWIEHNKAPAGGYGSIGVQFFVPINERVQLLYYDEDAYEIGKEGHIEIPITKNGDVNQINQLQYVNALSNVYGGGNLAEKYCLSIAERSNKFLQSKQSVTAQLGGYNLIANPGIRIKLNLSFIKFTEAARRFRHTNRLVYLRRHAERLHEQERANKT